MEAIYRQFKLDGLPVSCTRYGHGHINETYLLVTNKPRLYVLQKINTYVFQNAEGLMNNIVAVTDYLRKGDSDPRRVLTLVPTLEGKPYLKTESGECWRLYDFITGSICLDQCETEADFYASSIAFGDFQKRLAQFPARELVETIPHFHDTPDRYRQLKEAMANNRAGRLGEVAREIDFYLAREEEAGALMKLLAQGELPLRVTHNDTKLNNVMLDEKTREPLCVIDLDTVMPGLAANDFGDSIRFGASTAAEDERDLSKVTVSLSLYETYAKGFLGACGGGLTRTEIDTLPMGAKLMTLECGARFLTDYLNGDVYFHVAREGHNLDRARTQMTLVADMEKKWDEMNAIIARCQK